jgi:hypothetical protein
MFGLSKSDRIEQKLNRTIRLLRRILNMEIDMAVNMAAWEKALQDDTDATNAVETAINKLVEQIQAAGVHDPKLDAILAGIQANSARTAALALANTPVADPDPVPPAVPVINPDTGQPFPA